MSGNYCDKHQRSCDVWVGHCIIDKESKEVKQKVKITMDLHQASSNEPDGLTDGSGSHRSTLEIMHRSLPQRYNVSPLNCGDRNFKVEETRYVSHTLFVDIKYKRML